ncbi:MAG: transcriptional regulator [Ponticaulis sp.]|nr:transcriptional regulator [Ponticaulis sp.]
MLLVSETVKDLRTKSGWTQQHLAEICDVSVRTIQRVEKDGVASMETTLALASVFDVEKTVLLMDSAGAADARVQPKTSWVHGVAGLGLFFLGLGAGVLITGMF